MIEGIKIYAPNIDLKERIALSSGTTFLDSASILEYSSNSFIPKLPWRKPTNKEIEFLINQNGLADYSQLVNIVSFKGVIESHDLIKSYEDALNDKITYENYKNEALKILKTQLPKIQLTNDTETIVAGLAIHKKGLDTVTINKKTGKLVGLHLDSWDGKPINERHSSSNRICINLSKESRFLLFINLTVARLAALTNSSKIDIPDVVCNKFMSMFPNYPVIKLEIKPYEAYVAPTENMIHDATTQGMESDSLSFTYRGFFKLNTPSVSR